MSKKEARAEWLARRRTGIGGSDIAAILGVSPWKTPLNIYFDKTSETPEPDLPTVRQRVGTYLEPLAAEMYEEESGRRKVRRCNVLLKKDESHCIGNVDRLCCLEDGRYPWSKTKGVVTDMALEIKTSSDLAEWEEVPDHYVAQAQHYMGLMPTVMRFDFPVIFLARGTFRVYTVMRDDALIRDMQTAAEDFWQKHVATRNPPAPTTEDDARRLYAVSRVGKRAVASQRCEEVVARLREVKAGITELEAESKSLCAAIQAEMQDAEELILPSGTRLASWKNNKPTEKTDWRAVADSLAETVGDPEAVARIVTANTIQKEGARVFRLCAEKAK